MRDFSKKLGRPQGKRFIATSIALDPKVRSFLELESASLNTTLSNVVRQILLQYTLHNQETKNENLVTTNN